MNCFTQFFQIMGHVGNLECAVDLPDFSEYPTPIGVALLAHPHPLFGGTMHNKVVQTLVRAFLALGYVTARMNFRGVGNSDGKYDYGNGETDDMLLLLAHVQKNFSNVPLILAGFSFGTYVQAHVQQRLIACSTSVSAKKIVQNLIFVGSVAGKWQMPKILVRTTLIHGARDEIIPLDLVLNWAEVQELPVIVVPGADHFFHHKLQYIKDIVMQIL